MQINKRSPLLFMIPFLLLVMFLAVRHLNHTLVWYDERVSFFFAGVFDESPLSLIEVIQRNLELDRHPFLFYIILRLWVDAVGISEFTGRTLSLLFGLLGLAWLYRLSYDMSRSYAVAFGAVVTMGLSGLYVHHMHEMRFYTILPTFVTMSLWGYWHLSQGKRREKFASAVMVIGLIGGLYLYFPFAFFAALLGLWHLGVMFLGKGESETHPYQSFSKNKKQIFGLLALSAAVSLPLYLITYFNSLSRAEPLFYSGEGLGQIDILAQTIFYLGNNFPLVFLLLFILSFVFVRERAFVWISFLGIGLYLVLFIVSQSFAEVHNLRNFLIVWPMFAVMIGYSVRTQSRIPYAVPIVIFAILGIGTATNLNMKHLESFDPFIVEEFFVEDQFLLECGAYDDGFHFTDAALEKNPSWWFDDYGYFLETKELWSSLLGYYYAGRGIEENDSLDAMPSAENWWIISADNETVPQLSAEEMIFCGSRTSENAYNFALYSQDCQTVMQQCSFWHENESDLITNP